MTTLLLIILFLLGAFVIFLANINGDYEVRRSHTYDVDINTVFDKIRDFRSWPDWSPWLVHEPECSLQFSPDCDKEGGSYEWNGKAIGAGKMTHVSFDAPTKIQEKLEFVRPFKSVCDVSFELAEENGKTTVTWIMNAHMPFFMRFMIARTKDMLGYDFAFGLAMLAGELNPESEHPKIKFAGDITLDSKLCLCKPFEGNLEAMQTAMQQGFPELMSYVESSSGSITAPPMSVYYKANMKKMYFVCDMAIPVSADVDAGKYELKQLGGGRFFKIEVNGSYDFLELAWYSAMCHIKMYKLKIDTKRPSFEVYETDPESVTHSNEIKTVLMLPLK